MIGRKKDREREKERNIEEFGGIEKKREKEREIEREKDRRSRAGRHRMLLLK